jgi:competence protein ComEC
VCVALFVAAIFAVSQARVGGTGETLVHILDVGQGDSILLVSPSGKQVLVDGGPDLSALSLIAQHMPFFDRSIDLLVLTHPNLDHLASLPQLLSRYRVARVLLTGVDFESDIYDEFLALLDEMDIALLTPDPMIDIDFGDGLTFDVVWPRDTLWGKPTKDENNTSIVLRAITGSRSILLTGDMEEKEEREILASGADIRSTYLKVAHHGSKTSTSTGFLLAVDPELAVISVGAKNSYGHPHSVILERFRHFGIPVRTTAQEGTVTLRLE